MVCHAALSGPTHKSLDAPSGLRPSWAPGIIYTGNYTADVWQRHSSESSFSLLPTLRGISGNFISFRPRKSERRFAAVAPDAAFVSITKYGST